MKVKLLVILIILSLTSCSSMGTMTATITPMKVAPTVAIKRIKFNKDIRIIFPKNVKENFEINPTSNMTQKYTNFGKTLRYTLKKAFQNNFKKVKFSRKEKNKGIELIIGKAEVLATNQISFQVSILKDGQELLDFYGTTKGRTIASSANALGDLDQQYTTMVKSLMESSVRDFGAHVYDNVLRSEKFNANELK